MKKNNKNKINPIIGFNENFKPSLFTHMYHMTDDEYEDEIEENDEEMVTQNDVQRETETNEPQFNPDTYIGKFFIKDCGCPNIRHLCKKLEFYKTFYDKFYDEMNDYLKKNTEKKFRRILEIKYDRQTKFFSDSQTGEVYYSNNITLVVKSDEKEEEIPEKGIT